MSRQKGSARTFLAARGTVAVASIVIVVLAVAIGGVAIAKGSDSTSTQAAVQSATTDWPVNERGQTYGSEVKAQSEADVPDLVSVVATNGKHGYCLNSQLNATPEPPKTAEEAEAMMRAVLCEVTVIPVYESDGTTQIGVFEVGGPGVTMTMGDADGNTVTKTGKADGTIITKTEKSDGAVITEIEKPDGTITTTKSE